MIIKEYNLPSTADSPKKIYLPYCTAKAASKSILKVDSIKGTPKMWYLEIDDPIHEKLYNEFWIIGLRTNQNYEDYYKEYYIGSTYAIEKSFILHYYILPSEITRENASIYFPIINFIQQEKDISIEEKQHFS